MNKWAGGEELAKLVERLDKASTAYNTEISAEKTKLMTNNNSDINTEMKANGQKLETVTSFKYLGSVITDEGSKPYIGAQWKGEEDKGRQMKRWEDNIREWTGLELAKSQRAV